MNAELLAVHPVFMTQNLPRALDFYERLGFRLAFRDAEDPPAYAGLGRDQIEIHLQAHAPAAWPADQDRPTYRFVVDDVDRLYLEFQQAQIPGMTQPKVTAWGTYEFHIQDPDGNGLQFYQDFPRLADNTMPLA